MNYDTFTLDNGIRLIHSRTNTFGAHMAVLMNTGSRDEKEDEHGMAHLVEHMLFKGTEKRKAFHIISRLEDVGGDINAYTTKEETCVYASFLKGDYARAAELMQDVLFHSAFPARELKKEKDIIIDEINSYLDDPADLIFDEFEDHLFKGHPIGRNILGTIESLRDIERPDIIKFLDDNYATSEMVVCSVGNIAFDKWLNIVRKYFGDIPAKSRKRRRKTVHDFSSQNITQEKNTFQVHALTGTRAYPVKDKRRITLHLLNNILGGPGLNSRLNMTLRERNGYSYQTESHYTPYSDTGVLNVYFSCDKNKLNQCRDVVYRELRKLRTQRLGSLQLLKAKKQLIGQVAISSENYESLMLAMAKSFMIFDKFESTEEIKEKIDVITADQILEAANEILDEKNLFSLTYI
ncbi:MAG: insulinase family protein [Calditrichaeota bacterium]|nr:MAG: insulinase family protein [Calditrichota bacterium]